METHEEFGKVHLLLVLLTLIFVATLGCLAHQDRVNASKDTYTVTTETRVLAESDTVREPIDINTADAEQLQELMGIGPVLAQAIVDYRTEHGPFASVDELLYVSGIGKGKLNSIRDDVTVGAEEGSK